MKLAETFREDHLELYTAAFDVPFEAARVAQQEIFKALENIKADRDAKQSLFTESNNLPPPDYLLMHPMRG